MPTTGSVTATAVRTAASPWRRHVIAARSPRDILARMGAIVQAHATDVAPWGLLSLSDFFDLVRRGGYNREPTSWSTQILARPGLTISKAVPVTACANKAIILASWAQLHRIPWRLVAVGRVVGRAPHHVFPEFFMGGAWRSIDATYPWGALFVQRSYPVREVWSPPPPSIPYRQVP